jgi:hypothetical protein
MASVVISGDTSGAITISAPAVAGTNTLTLPVATDTLVGKATTDTLTNKTLTSPTLTTPALGTPASGVMTNVTGINYDGFKSRIINGAMVLDQRNAGASVTPADGAYTLDRWFVYQFVASKFSVQQNAGSVTPPVGFSNYLGVTSLSAYTVLSGGANTIAQAIEGFNTADLQWGTANAKTVTLSFQVYSSLTGTFGGSIQNSAANRSYPFTYTISSANTWTSISVTIAGDTSGTWVGATNGKGMVVFFGLGVGSSYSTTAGAWAGGQYFAPTGAVSVVGTNGATFYITGVQLEKGSTATSFDYRPYGTELQLCQRYYENSFEAGTAVANAQNATAILIYSLNGSADRTQAIFFKVQKRALCTFAFYSPNIGGNSAGQWMVYAGSWSTGSSTSISDNGYQYFHLQTTFSATQNYTYLASGNWTASAEL